MWIFLFFFFFSSRRRHTRLQGDWSSDVCSSDLAVHALAHTLFALRREGTGRGTHRLDLAEIGRRLEVNLLGESVRLLRGGPLIVVPTGKLHAVPWGLMPSLRERATA